MEERETKLKFWKGVLVGALVTAFGGLIAVGVAAGIWVVGRSARLDEMAPIQAAEPGTVQAEESMKPETIKAETDSSEPGKPANREVDANMIMGKIGYIQQLIDEYYLFEGDDEQEDPVEWMYSGYVHSLQDPYSSYYTDEEYQTLMESNEGEYCGIGVQVSQNVYTGIVKVVKVFKGAPAEEGGMLPGDVITAVEGMDISGMDLSLVVSEHIKGEEGTDVTLTVYRESVDDYLDLTMKRAIVQNPTVEYTMLDDGIGYIFLSAFEEVSAEQFKTAVDQLEKDGMTGLILDMRNNGGGVVTAAKSIADYVLADGKTIVSFKGKGVPDNTYLSEDGHELKVPMVVLVNGESASAAEVVTGALKDHEAAVIVGTNTFGKGIAQGIFPIPDGSALKLTTAYYYVPSGECIHEIGIAPHVEVELKDELKSLIEIPKDEDNQLQAAIDVLQDGEEAVKEQLKLEAELVEDAGEDPAKEP